LDLVETGGRPSRDELEYELIDTGVFDDDRYFDVYVEYTKQSPDDILIKISVSNRGPEPATLDVLPTLWFRKNTGTGGLNAETRTTTGTRAGWYKRHCGDARGTGRTLAVYRRRQAASFCRERNAQQTDLRHAQCETVRQGRHQ
jgi:hypothetical protein